MCLILAVPLVAVPLRWKTFTGTSSCASCVLSLLSGPAHCPNIISSKRLASGWPALFAKRPFFEPGPARLSGLSGLPKTAAQSGRFIKAPDDTGLLVYFHTQSCILPQSVNNQTFDRTENGAPYVITAMVEAPFDCFWMVCVFSPVPPGLS
jgi:hypothetical protein